MSLVVINMSSSSHATVSSRNLSCKQHDGQTSNFTCNAILIFYMYIFVDHMVYFRKEISQSVSNV